MLDFKEFLNENYSHIKSSDISIDDVKEGDIFRLRSGRILKIDLMKKQKGWGTSGYYVITSSDDAHHNRFKDSLENVIDYINDIGAVKLT